jgi:short-subunit dehydrogenase
MVAMQAMIAVNITALTRLTHAAANGFLARGGGTLVNISSVVAVAPELLNGVYGGTKAYVLAFSQALRHELSGKGVRVQVVLPGAIATEFWKHAGKPVTELPADMVMTADEVVDAALAGLDLGEFVTVPSLPDISDWHAFESARDVLRPNLSRAHPAQRYRPA